MTTDLFCSIWDLGGDVSINHGKLECSFPCHVVLEKSFIELLGYCKTKIIKRIHQNEFIRQYGFLVLGHGELYIKKVSKSKEFFINRVSEDTFTLTLYIGYKSNYFEKVIITNASLQDLIHFIQNRRFKKE